MKSGQIKCFIMLTSKGDEWYDLSDQEVPRLQFGLKET